LDEKVRFLHVTHFFISIFSQRWLDEEVRILKRILMVPLYMEIRKRDELTWTVGKGTNFGECLLGYGFKREGKKEK
jgi:hypothetical protein